jgi:hypothetical protein
MDALAGAVGLPLLAVGSIFTGKVREEGARNRSTAMRATDRASGLVREDLAEAVAGTKREPSRDGPRAACR